MLIIIYLHHDFFTNMTLAIRLCSLLVYWSLVFTSSSAGSVAEGGDCLLSNNRVDPITLKSMADCDDKTFCSSPLPVQHVKNNKSSPISMPEDDITQLQVSEIPGTGIGNASNGTCTKRLCRRDEYQHGFLLNETLPPLCEPGYFCPDEGSGCRPLSPAGSYCEINRDYQCSAPVGTISNSNLGSVWNFNGSVCVQSRCMFVMIYLSLSTN